MPESPRFAVAIDQGTTSTRCMIFDHSGSVVCFDQREHEQIYPKPGWVEHNPDEIWERTQGVVKGALQKGSIDTGDIAADLRLPADEVENLVFGLNERQGIQPDEVSTRPSKPSLRLV